jgi:hypothetical protein
MKIVEVKLYQFDELSDKAKEKARDWFRSVDDFDANYEPAETAAKLLGIEFGVRTISLMSGKTRQEVDIRYSGFSSQGDGASFTGTYSYRKGCSKAIRAEFGKDDELYRITDELTALQKKHGYKLHTTITQSGRDVHKYTMDTATIIDTPAQKEVEQRYAEGMLGLMRDFAQWIYDGLEEEYNYRQSDEAVDEDIRANEYDFREDGRRSDG